jgi:small subunit ribosomal protein S4e
MKRHLKRLNAPKTWKVQRRGIKFITRTNPGGMPKELTMSISNVLKYELKIAGNAKEVNYLIKDQELLVNGIKVTDYRYPINFTDVFSLPQLNQYYRMIIDTDGTLKMISISKEESQLKIAKIIGKRMVKGKMQLNLFDGRNVFFEKQHYKTHDSLIITLPEQLVKEHLSFEKGALVLLYKGKHVGKIGTLEDVKGNSVIVKTANDSYETKKEYVLVLGKDKPMVKITK